MLSSKWAIIWQSVSFYFRVLMPIKYAPKIQEMRNFPHDSSKSKSKEMKIENKKGSFIAFKFVCIIWDPSFS